MRQSTVADLSPKHLRLSTALRTAIIALLILALMQPIFYRYGSAISTVYLLDISESVSSASIQNAIQWVRKTTDIGHPSDARYIAFASNSISFDSVDALTQVSVSNHAGRGGRETIDQSETNIASALDGALHHFAPDHLKRLVLISDGNETSGDLAEMLPRLRQEHVPVFTLPLEARSDQDAWIEAIRTPTTVAADEQFPVEVQIFSPSNTTGEVEIRNGRTVLARRTALLEKGLNRIAFETSIAASTGTVMLEGTVTVAGDARVENNVFRQPIVVSGRPRVLYVEGHPASARYLQSALAEGFTVDVLDARQFRHVWSNWTTGMKSFSATWIPGHCPCHRCNRWQPMSGTLVADLYLPAASIRMARVATPGLQSKPFCPSHLNPMENVRPSA